MSNAKVKVKMKNSSRKQRKRKIVHLSSIFLAFLLCSSAEAQQPKKIGRIGYVTGRDRYNANPQLEAFRRGLRDVGYAEGKNILVEYRYADGNTGRASTLVDELVRLKVDLLVTAWLPAINAAKRATTTIPILMVTTVDPVASGIVTSLARPGGNITGLTTLSRELSGKRLELVKEIVPKISRIGVLWAPENPGAPISFKEYESAARALKIELQSLEIRINPDFEQAFQAAAKASVGALICIRSILLNRDAKQIADLAIKNRLPSMYEGSEYMEAGGLMIYGPNDAHSWSRAAIYVDKILKGAKPADLPVEQPTKFELVINLKTAKQIGLTIPPQVLARADKVIR
jgi:putative ABC transport system substrate-binding protein